ncbi:hypothetical protein CI109_101037 [Kwoniella shandongensis]|uniref:Polyadenylation factor subunit 2 n=1 Tax=Kwoniella shandongensis TaxID=1734106 RepID=A0A5M6C8K7_9TREE|nr:uncharacterized protein CI109_001506 [Kwoniella shandongensis]KAA5530102.1 hypothetical protein CI109_001506 [Kwoniella shandongensis]
MTTTTTTASAVAGPSRGPDTWQPTRYLEPNHPDNEEVLEQAAYQAAVTRQGGDDRKRKIKPRRTVDYQGGVQKWRMITKMKGNPEIRPAIHPNPSDIVNVLPPAAHRLNPSTSICDQWVHTSINKERSPTRVVRWTPDARRLLTGNDKGQFTLWNGSSFNYESITQVHDDSIRSFTYSHNGQALVSTDKIGTIKYFTPHLTNIHGFQGHREACHGISWSPNDERFVTGGDDGLVKIWSYREAREEKVLSGHGWDVRCVDWHPTKGLVVSGSKDMLVKFWDPRTGKDLSTLHSHKSTINTCSWSPDGHLVATAGGDGVVRLFDIRTFRELEAMTGHTKEINCLEWHPIHHNLFVSGDAAGTINYYSLLSPDPSKPLTSLEAAHEDAVFSLSFHPLGHLLCSGSKDFTARFWSRARPVGGHEHDRWHVGEEKALRLNMEAEMGGVDKTKRDLHRNEDTNGGMGGGLPGLSNLVAAVNGGGGGSGRNTPNVRGRTDGPSGGSSLPGFGGYSGGSNPPPTRQWGEGDSAPSQGGEGGGFPRARGPLPSQNEMLRKNAVPEGRGPPGGGGGFDRDSGNGGRRNGGFNGGGGGGGGGNGGPPMGGGGGYGGPPPQQHYAPPSTGYNQPPPSNNYGPPPGQNAYGQPPPPPTGYGQRGGYNAQGPPPVPPQGGPAAYGTAPPQGGPGGYGAAPPPSQHGYGGQPPPQGYGGNGNGQYGGGGNGGGQWR